MLQTLEAMPGQREARCQSRQLENDWKKMAASNYARLLPKNITFKRFNRFWFHKRVINFKLSLYLPSQSLLWFVFFVKTSRLIFAYFRIKIHLCNTRRVALVEQTAQAPLVIFWKATLPKVYTACFLTLQASICPIEEYQTVFSRC